MRGFDSNTATRSSLGWEMIRLLKEVELKPKIVIFENVAMITSNKFKDTLNLFKNDLINLGYKLYDNILSATDYEIPQTRRRYFLIALLDNNEYNFPKKIVSNIKLKDLLENDVDEEYYLTTDVYKKIDDNTLIFHNKKNDQEYEINIDKYNSGGVCGIDKSTKYHQSSRLFSQNGYAPTMTANSTANNAKVVVE